MALSSAEQYMLEMVNRTRLDPAAEAARWGISLNFGLPAGTLENYSRQVLAPNTLLEKAASGHSLWMLETDTFAHQGENGSNATERVQATGYVTTGAGENLAWFGTTGQLDLLAAITDQHRDLFLSKLGHRENMLTDSYREIGLAQEVGEFRGKATDNKYYDFNASLVTQNFSKSGSVYFVTGVTYSDRDGNGFYSIGEGVSGTTFATAGASARSAAAGGYALKATQSNHVEVTGSTGLKTFSATLDLTKGNAKLDLVNGNTFFTSSDILLGTGIHRVKLLGLDSLDATGNGAGNMMTGNKGANILSGKGGRDVLSGADGRDKLLGGSGIDKLNGGTGDDQLDGGSAADFLTGGAGRDSFVFARNGGTDKVFDFASEDQLRIDDGIWGGTQKTAAQVMAEFGEMVSGNATIDFHNGQVITLIGVRSLGELIDDITII